MAHASAEIDEQAHVQSTVTEMTCAQSSHTYIYSMVTKAHVPSYHSHISSLLKVYNGYYCAAQIIFFNLAIRKVVMS